MFNNFNRRYSGILGLLLLSIVFRLFYITYGYDNPCLVPPEENWLYDNPQPVSLYSWSVNSAYVQTKYDSTQRTVARDSAELVLMRLMGVFTGLLTVALTLFFARQIGSNWFWIAGLFTAVSILFVDPDRWIVRFDPAVLAVAISISLSLLISQKRLKPQTLYLFEWLRYVSILSLVLLAPPLWWLAIILLLNTQLRWKPIASILLSGIILIPALQVPQNWLNAAQSWDSGATAACLWGGLALCLWRWPNIRPVAQAILVIAVLISGSGGLFITAQLPVPTVTESALIKFLQERLPDSAVVRFTSETFRLASVVACPHQANISFTAQKPLFNFPFAPPNPQKQTQPDFVIFTDSKDTEGLPFVYNIGSRFFVENTATLPNPTDIEFGDALHLTSYSIVTPKVKVGDLVDIRLDYQFSSTVNVDVTHYILYMHFTDSTDASKLIVNYNVPLIDGPNDFRPRQYIFDKHHRVTIPDKAPPGLYEITLGIYDTATGKQLSSSLGHELTLGTIEIQ